MIYYVITLVIVIFGLLTLLITRKYKKTIQLIDDDNEFEIAGFAYEEEQDIFYSVLDAWQREYGYCHFYDVMATPLSMVIDSEPIIFEYNDKLWLIEFWKGQYGMTTGAEIGIYSTDIKNKKSINKKVHFNKISNNEMLQMSYTLLKNNEIYFRRSARHWWLTGFKLGDFANPEELKMYININFKSTDMRNAFVNTLFKIGYTEDNVDVINNRVYILFNKPYSKKPFTRIKFLDNIAQRRNKMFVNIYRKLTNGADNTIDKIKILKQKHPKLYNRIIKIGLSRSVYKFKNNIKRDGE